jgi:predicted transcriptional regulator
MKSTMLSIRLDRDMERMLTKVSRDAGMTRSEVARDALRRHLRIRQFDNLRRRIMPFAEARGFLTDDDVFSKVS